MPSVYVHASPLPNEFVIGGSDQYYMNKIADAIVTYLQQSGVQVTRSQPGTASANAIQEANNGDYDLYFSVYSNASPPYLSGSLQGPDILFYADSQKGQQAAEIIAENLAALYPRPNLVNAIPSRTVPELRESEAVAIRAEVGYRDNLLDAVWIQDNLNAIGRILALGITQALAIPFVREPEAQ